MSFLIIKNEDGGINIENTNTKKERFYGHNVYEPERNEEMIFLRKVYSNEKDDRFEIIRKLADITSIYNGGVLQSTPTSMQDLYKMLRGFFLTKRLVNLEYKVLTMPIAEDEYGVLTAFSGFSKDYGALTSEAKWAVKKQFQDGSQEWSGKLNFDQILDDYLTLTYS